jgi:hypothetical protein
VEAEAARLEEWIGPARVTGSFPTPLEIETRASTRTDDPTSR